MKRIFMGVYFFSAFIGVAHAIVEKKVSCCLRETCYATSLTRCQTECGHCMGSNIDPILPDLCPLSEECQSFTAGQWKQTNTRNGVPLVVPEYSRKISCETKKVDGVCTDVYTYECGCGITTRSVLGGYSETYYYASDCDTTTGIPTCESCPDGGMTVVPGIQIADCYIPAGDYSDDMGQYELTTDCHYTSAN